jgi:hypothetical protein
MDTEATEPTAAAQPPSSPDSLSGVAAPAASFPLPTPLPTTEAEIAAFVAALPDDPALVRQMMVAVWRKIEQLRRERKDLERQLKALERQGGRPRPRRPGHRDAR